MTAHFNASTDPGPGLEGVRGIRAADGTLLDIVCIAASNWGVVKSNPEYTLLGLAERGHRILVVEPFESVWSAVRMARTQSRGIGSLWGLRAVAPNIWAYRPFPAALPGQSRTPLAARVSGRLLAPWIARQMRRLGFRRSCVWSFLYNAASLAAALPAELRIYECGDDDAALARSDGQRGTVRRLDAESCKGADLVFAVTEELCAPRRVHNPRTFEVNCAADVGFFARALDPSTEVPPAIGRLDGPVLGYVGGLDPWKIDVPLLTEMARLRPRWSIALVGYVWFGFDHSVFRDVANIHVLGPQPYADLPRFMKGMDVGLLPFPLNDITRAGDALKCYEYLAAGLPVVGRDVPVARRFPRHVAIADTAAEFIAACERQLADTATTPQARSEAMRPHDWSRRVAQKVEIVRERLT
ncbi:MAG: glycosyltransferase [Rhizobiaceae bacterium]|nr:glycosyltransferase [Rhizobiaceae bacterium]